MDKLVTWLKDHWFLIVAFFSISAAYGQATTKIQTLEEAIKANSSVTQEIKELRSQAVRADERLKAMAESQIRQERMIEMMLMNQQQLVKSQAIAQEKRNAK